MRSSRTQDVKGKVEGLGQGAQDRDAPAALARLDLREVWLADARCLGQGLLREACLLYTSPSPRD